MSSYLETDSEKGILVLFFSTIDDFIFNKSRNPTPCTDQEYILIRAYTSRWPTEVVQSTKKILWERWLYDWKSDFVREMMYCPLDI
ncbi:unnamed protein product [Lactuca virosa]|uniref:DUF5641 domain-containing protein n=1 Tax=Lactuca virosa TaxID=75947 RepID=A0AAU9PFW0_9ASTR|nr:unnamed protein product [Lactuca virosa]